MLIYQEHSYNLYKLFLPKEVKVVGEFKMKTYRDSYLYNVKSAGNTADQTKELLNFITKAHRIDKHSDAFRGVIEDIKRQQSSGYLISILMNPYVVLCIGDAPLPRAFTVFDAKDSKSNNAPRVFIDLTGRVEFKDGYYVARRNEVDKICALILDAMIYMLYRYYPLSIVNNSNTIFSSCSCYVSMFSYIIDYLRIIGYSENKKKIQYIIGMYFLIGLVGVDNIPYARSVAAKVADVSVKDGEAFEILIDNDFSAFDNIATFIEALAKGFRLRGLDLGTFVGKWMKLFGTGTQYACELLTSFLILTINAYTGSYIVNQRQIEVACNAGELTKLYTAIAKAGHDTLGKVKYETVDYTMHDVIDSKMREAKLLREEIALSNMYVSDYSSQETALNEAEDAFTAYRKAVLDGKLGKLAYNSIANGVIYAYESCVNILNGKSGDYDHGALTAVAKYLKENGCKMSEKEIYDIQSSLDRDGQQLSNYLEESQLPQSSKSDVAKVISEFRSVQKYM
jgi:hypothetical protein